MFLVLWILLLVFVLAIASRAVASAARLGLAVLTVLLVLLAGRAVWRLAAMPAPVRVAYSAEESQTPIPVHAKKPAKASLAPVVKATPAVEEAEESTIPLEAEPGKTPLPARPAWLDRAPTQAGDVCQVPVSSGPQEKLGECRPAVEQELRKAVAAYIDEYFGPSAAGQLRPSDVIAYDLGYIHKHLVKPGNTFEEKLRLSFGPMYQTHALLEFGPAFRKELDGRRGELERYVRETATAYRLRGLALGFGAVLCLLSVVFGYFRLDTATRGYYTGRLQFLAATAILIVIVAGALLANRMMWM
jgi:hypothetical protein